MAQPASPLSVGSLAQLTLSLLAIVALIFAISWALKRFKMAGAARSRGDRGARRTQRGPRERIVLLRVGESQVLVGIGAGGVVALTPLATPIVTQGGLRPRRRSPSGCASS